MKRVWSRLQVVARHVAADGNVLTDNRAWTIVHTIVYQECVEELPPAIVRSLANEFIELVHELRSPSRDGIQTKHEE